ncbi:DNA-binding domain-containing protein [Bacillus atrophaeus]|uniref:Two-component response regulator n=1 Tax=Bacillus atrophaeus (strain 1942) TaxID=720555 RepID=A0ABM5M3X6_BACA1|nr:DNA-binding domain-containing protein [Bacillus atrophaeus]AMR64255.1 transcriptional regulator [Bacillus subtilis subsp. globigii]ADP34889.1 two-component response regulator [Bacillus atrophaeus 1942]AIK48771.1 response regulator [Bacillus atrophaeus subsp. globigii]EIM09791.1 two-component response regulator [Bacillus atrophaeus C89]KFK80890.1 response regulator [Bacillus atrophaeus]
MRFFIADDDRAVRSILRQIIEDEDLGEVAGEAEDGCQVEGHTLHFKKVDILLIDLLMPVRDGIETIRHLKDSYSGKIVMISQVEAKEMVGEAYSLGIEYFIHKPINRIEMISVLRKVRERVELENSIGDIQNSLSRLVNRNEPANARPQNKNGKSVKETGTFLLSELGIMGESGAHDLMAILQYLFEYEQAAPFEKNMPSLKQIFTNVAERKLGAAASQADINRETKASEQRIRRAIIHSLHHFASLGTTDFSNPKFENYASKFFDFPVVSQKMKEMQSNDKRAVAPARVNTKKFIHVFFLEAKYLSENFRNGRERSM